MTNPFSYPNAAYDKAPSIIDNAVFKHTSKIIKSHRQIHKNGLQKEYFNQSNIRIIIFKKSRLLTHIKQIYQHTTE